LRSELSTHSNSAKGGDCPSINGEHSSECGEVKGKRLTGAVPHGSALQPCRVRAIADAPANVALDAAPNAASHCSRQSSLQNSGDERLVDLKPHLSGEVFEPLKDLTYFGRFRVNEDLDTVVWENDADFSPDFLYEIGQPVSEATRAADR
jgi:hypothetical protein